MKNRRIVAVATRIRNWYLVNQVQLFYSVKLFEMLTAVATALINVVSLFRPVA
jgi:hypothetical protein